MARDTAWRGELPEQARDARPVQTDIGIDLAVGALKPGRGNQRAGRNDGPCSGWPGLRTVVLLPGRDRCDAHYRDDPGPDRHVDELVRPGGER